MRNMMPLLETTDFPAIRRARLQTLQVNLGYKCNQACFHCHVNAGPTRREMMDRETVELVLQTLKRRRLATLDVTGGAPELHPDFRHLIREARRLGVHTIDRCNLTVLEEAGQQDTARFLADHGVEIIASLPCYLEENVNAQRGDGVFDTSIRVLRALNELGYGKPESGLTLNLVYNPVGPQLPPGQQALEADYKRELRERYGIEFNGLFTLANMPIARFGSTLVSRGQFDDYMRTLKDAHRAANVPGVMCRELVSIDYRGYVYDCDFNQMLKIPYGGRPGKTHLRDLLDTDVEGEAIAVADHCYGCTAGQGSSCGGALNK